MKDAFRIRHTSQAWRLFVSLPSQLFDLASVFVRPYHVASRIVNPNHSIM